MIPSRRSDRFAAVVVFALLAIGAIPLLGRRATSVLHLDPIPRDHTRCVANVFSQTWNSDGAPLTSGVYYSFAVSPSVVIRHDHDGSAPLSDFERGGTQRALLAAFAFAVIYLWLRWIRKRMAPHASVRLALLSAFGMGGMLATPVALMVGWIAEEVTRGEPSLPSIFGALPPRMCAYLTIEVLGVAAVLAWFLGDRGAEESA